MTESHSEVLAEVRSLALADRRARDQLARRSGYGRAVWDVLSAVGQSDGGTVPQIGRRLGVSRQSVQRVADGLVDKRLAHYEVNPDHQRSPRLRLTPSGEQTLRSLDRAAAASEPDLEQDFEPEEIETALYVLRALREAL